ncbi:hypothetical protein ACH5RR_005053 [Cinchona calisaya]|uniref:Fe2OG dioxygenase domain-containing protein n=1 Tax=Cinchona calisaya TaxID=153742 RepID=A0ABD3B0A1_9GENT
MQHLQLQLQLQLLVTTLRVSSAALVHSPTASLCKFVLLGKRKMNRGIKSGIQRHHVRTDRDVSKGGVEEGDSVIGESLSNKTEDIAEQQILSLSTSNPSYESQWPLPSATKSKRRTRIDLAQHSEQTSHQGAAEHVHFSKLDSPLKSSSVNPSQQPNMSAPTTGSMKKHSSFPSGGQYIPKNSPERGGGVQNSRDSKRTRVNEPFDICPFRTRYPAVLKPSSQDKERLQGIQMDYSLENGQVLRSGMVLLRSYIPLSQQIDLVMRCRELGVVSGGFYQPGYKDGAKLRLHMMCLGLDWDPQTKKYGKRRHYDNSKPPNIPPNFDYLVSRALHDSQTLIKQQLSSNVEEILPCMSPNICIVNFYTTNGRLGLHQDRDESRESLLRGLPVVSFSLGDSAEFLYGDQRDVDEAERVLLKSGDVLIFGGKSRHIFHGVTSIYPNTAPTALLECTKLRPGRLNLTFRQH